MLEFKLNNQNFHLDRSTGVRVTWKNPFFSFSDLESDKGLGVELPPTPQNRALLQNPERFEKLQTGTKEFQGFSARFSGKNLITGTIVVEESPGNYSCWVRGAVGNIGKEFRDKNINELDIWPVNQQWVNRQEYTPENSDYNCPMLLNPYFFDEIGRNLPGTDESILSHQFRNGDASGYVNARNPDGTVMAVTSQANLITNPSNLGVTVVSPMLWLNYVIRKLLTAAGLNLVSSCLEDDLYHSKLSIYNNYDITGMSFGDLDTQWSEIKWLDKYDVKARAKIFQTLGRHYNGYFSYADLLPKITFKDLIISVQNITNTFLYIASNGDCYILSRETMLSGPTIDLSDYIVGKWKLGKRKDSTLKFSYEHDNDDLIYSERFKSIDDRRVDIGEPVESWADLDTIANPVLGEIRYIKSNDVFAEFRWVEKTVLNSKNEEVKTDMLGWEHLSIGFQNGYYNYGKPETTEISSKLSAVYSAAGILGSPQASHRGNMGSMKYSFQNFAPRLISGTGNVFGSLQWEGESGIINRNYKLTAPFISTLQPVEADFNLSVNVLDYIIRNRYSKFNTREGTFLIEEIEAEFLGRRMTNPVIKAYKF